MWVSSRRQVVQLGNGYCGCQCEITEKINVNSVFNVSYGTSIKLKITTNKKYENIKGKGDRTQKNSAVSDAAYCEIQNKEDE